MNKLTSYLKRMHFLSLKILKFSIIIWFFYVFSYALLRITYANSHTIELTIARCIEEYPILIFMSLSLGVVGAILIDIYAKTQQE